ncbi:phosphatase PAP2 family protein [Neolewinella agarilytica]|uniref:PAP2 superfamily protein n=1 Tax=Neolewinella agarilytica TaxID=478744 RepID=A0A1H9C3M4_9BACT|nr:phosphatase PAP2 family protein [Neolewinella agarilytica]SEP95806.1 PAP2 superfamily protein [Neolewinella agarilytica]
MPYQLRPVREVSLLLAGLSLIAIAVYVDGKDTRPIRVGNLRNPHAGSRNPLDALAFRTPDPAAAALADIGLYGGPTLPLLLSLHPRTRRQYPTILLIWLETILLNFAITSLLKNTVSRPRPYVLNPDFDARHELSRNDRAAFLSGHTSHAAAGSLLFAELVTSYAEKELVSITTYSLSGFLSGLTAYLRVKAAKHWPTDALAGLILGAVVGWLVPRLHRTP